MWHDSWKQRVKWFVDINVWHINVWHDYTRVAVRCSALQREMHIVGHALLLQCVAVCYSVIRRYQRVTYQRVTWLECQCVIPFIWFNVWHYLWCRCVRWRHSERHTAWHDLWCRCVVWFMMQDGSTLQDLFATHGKAHVLQRASLSATHCNTTRHAATHCDTLRHTATHCNTLQHTATKAHVLQCASLSATHCNALQHAVAHYNTLQQKRKSYNLHLAL